MGQTVLTDLAHDNPLNAAERDFIALGFATAAIILLVGTGGSVLPKAIGVLMGNGARPDNIMVSAMLLNIALVIFGWRRYRELTVEIAERRRAEARAQLLADTDPLTGCLNRRSMQEATEALRSRAKDRGEAIAYCMIDLDNFKQINDMHGHTAGDGVLVMLCQRVRAQLPGGAQLARLGGDEFAFVMTYPPAQRERVDDVVIRLYEQLSLPFALPELTIESTASIGLASDYEPDGSMGAVVDSSTLMHRADIALFHAKKQGRNRFYWFEPNMEHELRFRNQLEVGIRNGLARGEFVPFYEQQIDVESGKLVGFEMLARWKSPQLGLVSPEIFVPIAEQIGVIDAMSESLMQQAFIDARDWDDDLTLAVNISPVQLRDPWFAQRLLKQLVATNFPPQRLEIEITESCLHEDIGLVRSMITSLRNQGITISLDDFGTGYSSIEQLHHLPFDRIKIDRSFTSELRKPGGRSRIVEAIVSLGRGLDLPLTAEGVEDEEILNALKPLGRLKAQGYLYGLPEDGDDVRKRLQAEGRLANAEPTPFVSGADTAVVADDSAKVRVARP